MGRKHATLLLVVAVVVAGVPTSLGAVGGDATETAAQQGVPTVGSGFQIDAGGLQTDASGAQADASALARTSTNASATFENQTTDGTVVTISRVKVADGGFLAVHDRSLLNGSVLESVRGVSQFLEPGVHENVTVRLNEPVDESQVLFAIPYRDTNANEEYDFVESRGQDDGVYTVESQVVADAAFVTVEETPPETTTTPEERTTTPETTTPETTTTETTATPEETTTETTVTTAEVTATTTAEESVAERTVTFRIDNARVNQFSFVLGPGEVDRTIVVEDASIIDRTLELDVTNLMQGGSAGASAAEATSSELQTVRVVVRNVTIRNTEFVVTLPEGVTPRLEGEPVEIPDETTTEAPPEETTTEAPEETTTTAEPAETTTEAPDETTTTAAPAETTTQAPAEPAGLRVTDLNVPGTIVANEQGQLVVNAQVENPGDEAVTETVELRVQGTVVATQRVEVGPGETTPVQFQVEKADLDLEPGDAFVGVLTRNFGQVDLVTVREPGEETTTEDEEETTTEAPDETTTEAPGETTTAVPEETTAQAPAETTTAADGEADADAEETPSLLVAELDAPESFVLDDDTLMVAAQVENPGDEAVTETVELRVNGTVVAEQEVEVPAGETTTVEFEVDKADLGLEPGEAFLEVLTRDFGQSITVTVEAEADETTTAEE